MFSFGLWGNFDSEVCGNLDVFDQISVHCIHGYCVEKDIRKLNVQLHMFFWGMSLNSTFGHANYVQILLNESILITGDRL